MSALEAQRHNTFSTGFQPVLLQPAGSASAPNDLQNAAYLFTCRVVCAQQSARLYESGFDLSSGLHAIFESSGKFFQGRLLRGAEVRGFQWRAFLRIVH